MPAQYVKAYVKRNKTDAADAEAICEAVRRPTMRFVPIKTAEQQAAAMMLKTRALLVRQRTQTINALRAHLTARGRPDFAFIIEDLPDDRYQAIDDTNQIGATACWYDRMLWDTQGYARDNRFRLARSSSMKCSFSNASIGMASKRRTSSGRRLP